jgi:hypothetical protein
MQQYVTPQPGQTPKDAVPGWSRTTEIVNRADYKLSVTKRPVVGNQFLISIERQLPEFPDPYRIQLFLTKEEIEAFVTAIS